MKYLKGCGLTAVVFLTLALATCSYFVEEPNRAVVRLFNGDDRVAVNAITVYGQGRSIELKDAESVRYLTAALRNADRNWQTPEHEHSVSYAMLLHFGYLKYGNVKIGAGKDEDGVIAGYDSGSGDLLNHWIAFPKPIPEPVSDMLKRIRQP